MRWTLDTNVVASGLLWDGAPARLLDAARDERVDLFTSRVLLAELLRILRRDKFSDFIAASGFSAEDHVLGYAELTTVIEPATIDPVILKDPDDDHVLACALAGKVELIVSGDRHLLELGAYRGIAILPPAKALERIASRPA